MAPTRSSRADPGTDHHQPQPGSKIEPGISSEPMIEVVAKLVVALDLLEQLEDDARAEPANALDIPPPLRATNRSGLQRCEMVAICRPAVVASVFEMRRLCPGAAFSFQGRRSPPNVAVHLMPARR